MNRAATVALAARRSAVPPRLDAHVVVDARGVDARIQVPAGSTVALVGANGSGKTTIVEALAGLVATDQLSRTADGGIVLGDRALDGVPPWDRGIAIVDQRPVVLGRGTVADEAAFALTVRGIRSAAARDLVAPRLAEVGLADLADRRVTELSGGQIQRLAIARALAADPALLVLDEPFASLDAASVRSITELLARSRGTRTSILITHDPLDALQLADAVVVLDAGRVVEAGSVDAVLVAPAADATRAFVGGSIVSGVVRAGAIEVSTGPLSGGRLPLPAGSSLADGTAAIAAITPDGLVARALAS